MGQVSLLFLATFRGTVLSRRVPVFKRPDRAIDIDGLSGTPASACVFANSRDWSPWPLLSERVYLTDTLFTWNAFLIFEMFANSRYAHGSRVCSRRSKRRALANTGSKGTCSKMEDTNVCIRHERCWMCLPAIRMHITRQISLSGMALTQKHKVPSLSHCDCPFEASIRYNCCKYEAFVCTVSFNWPGIEITYKVYYTFIKLDICASFDKYCIRAMYNIYEYFCRESCCKVEWDRQ